MNFKNFRFGGHEHHHLCTQEIEILFLLAVIFIVKSLDTKVPYCRGRKIKKKATYQTHFFQMLTKSETKPKRKSHPIIIHLDEHAYLINTRHVTTTTN